MAQPSRGLVLHPTRKVSPRGIVQLGGATAGAYRCLHRRLQQPRRPVRLDKKARQTTALQKSPYQQSVSPGTSRDHNRWAPASTPLAPTRVTIVCRFLFLLVVS